MPAASIGQQNSPIFLHNNVELQPTLQNDDFFDLQSALEAPTYQAFSPFQFVSNVKQTIEWLTLSY